MSQQKLPATAHLIKALHSSGEPEHIVRLRKTVSLLRDTMESVLKKDLLVLLPSSYTDALHAFEVCRSPKAELLA